MPDFSAKEAFEDAKRAGLLPLVERQGRRQRLQARRGPGGIVNNRDRADGATKVARVIEFLAACLLIFVAFYGLGYMALIGDEIREARIAECEKHGVCNE